MARNFVKTLVIATVFVTGVSASSARASNDDLAAFLATTIFLFALGSALDGNVEAAPAPQPPRSNPGTGHRYKHQVPYECLKSFTTQNGRVRTFEMSCMRQKYPHHRRIPKSCEQTLWTSVGLRYGYEPQCLRNNGFRAQR